MLPYAGGPYAYVRKGLGNFQGYITGVLTIVEFLFAASAITISIDSYISNIFPNNSKIYLAAGFYLFFLIMHIIGSKQSAIIQLIMAGISVSALIMFFMGTADSVNLLSILDNKPFINGYKGIIQSIPFALWFYLCIEGISLAAEETKNPKGNMKLGFRNSILTVCIVNMLVLVFCLSSVDLKLLLSNDYPLSSVLEIVQPDDKVLLTVFSVLALSSLLASLNGMINGYSRQIFALSRAGYLPKILCRIHPMTKTPYLAIIIPGIIGITLAYNLNAKTLIFTAVIAALFMYISVIHSYIKLKIDEYKKSDKKIYKRKWIIVLCVINSMLFVFALISIINAEAFLSIIIFSLIVVLYYFLIGRRLIVNDAPEEMEAREDKIIVK